jgi:hypothetical protein
VILGEYLRTKGQHFATKSDFESLTAQLKANTELVARVNSDFAQRDWIQREWTTLRRQKLEAFLQQIHVCEDYLNRATQWSLKGDLSLPPSPPGQLVMGRPRLQPSYWRSH